MLVFYFFALIVIWLGILSLRSGFRFAAYVRRETSRPLLEFTPFVSVIAPCRGLEEGLQENLAALFAQDYPAYEIVFVVDSSDDASLAVIRKLTDAQSSLVSTRVIVAGPAVESGQKVHNLRAAVIETDPRCEALAFVDSDARPDEEWLRSLVAPLADETVGAASGYRWFIADKGGFASELRSVWNASIASALGECGDKNFCWGGSTAIRKATFDNLKIRERWRGTVSDDFTMTRVLHEAGLAIHFVPACLVPTVGNCTMRELWEFTNRQLIITRVYSPHLWLPLLVGSILFCSVFFGGVFLVAARAFLGRPFLLPLALLAVIYGLGAAKAYIRLKAVMVPLQRYKNALAKSLPAHLVLWPLASSLYLCNAIVAAFSRRINWSGISYELKSASEAVIIARES